VKIPNFRIPLFKWSWGRPINKRFRQAVPDAAAECPYKVEGLPSAPLSDAFERRDWEEKD
jgi:hypothetical protein